jgi:hypothetical protein
MTLADLLPLLEGELEGLAFGEVALRVQVRDGRPNRAEVSRSRSIMLPTDAICAGLPQNAEDSGPSPHGVRRGER